MMHPSSLATQSADWKRVIRRASKAMDTYFGGRGRHAQCHLSVWMDLCNHHQPKLGHHGVEGHTLVIPMMEVLKVTKD